MKKVKLKMVGLDGNAFAVMAAFERQARKEGWTQEEINAVLDKAMAGDYSNLISTIAEHCVNPL
jgi:hypothetical protein